MPAVMTVEVALALSARRSAAGAPGSELRFMAERLSRLAARAGGVGGVDDVTGGIVAGDQQLQNGAPVMCYLVGSLRHTNGT